MLQTKLDTVLIRILHICSAMIVLLQVLDFPSAVSLLFSATFILTAALWVIVAMRKINSLDILVLCVIVVALLNIGLNAWITGAAVSLGSLRKFVIFAFTLLYFAAAHKLSIDSLTEKLFFWSNSLLAAFLILYFYTNNDQAHLFNNIYTEYLTFNFTNPNLTAMFLICIFFMELLQLFRQKQTLLRLLHLVLAGFMFYFIIETRSRNCLLVATGVSAVLAVVALRKKEPAFPRWMAVLVAVFPILFAAAYLIIVDSPVFQILFRFLVSDGKDLDSRLTMWTTALEEYMRSPFLGAYNQITQGDSSLQMHNTHIDILVSYGPVVLLLVCFFLAQCLRQERGRGSKYDFAAAVCFSGTLIMGMAEASLFSGGLGLYLLAGVFLLLQGRLRQDEETIAAEVSS